MTTKNIFDYSHVKSVSAFALINIDTAEIVGRIIANFSDNPAGSVCTAQIFFDHPKLVKKTESYKTEFLKGQTFEKPLIGKAGGYGYDKLSSAICTALYHNCKQYPQEDVGFNGAGVEAAEKYFIKHFNVKFVKIV